MEKIYMEEHNNKKQNLFQKISNSKVAMASLALVFVAALSLVIIGLDKTSFAEEVDIGKGLPSTTTSFVTNDAGNRIYPSVMGLVVLPYTASVTTGSTTKIYPIFCLERNVGYVSGKTFTRGPAVEDYGLLYLMANIYPNKNFKDPTDSTGKTDLNNSAIQTWLSQIAVWYYIGETTTDPEDDIDIGDIKKVKSLNIERDDDGDSDEVQIPIKVDAYTDYIKPVVENAKSVKSSGVDKINFAVNFDNTVNTSEDKEYYQTSLISVTANNPFASYSLKLDTAPKGAYVVDQNGNKISDLNNIQPNVKFYIRIPVSSVTDKANAVKFTAVANGVETYSGYKFVAEGAQTVTNVFITTSNVEDSDEFVLKVPDTGMSTAQTVYFIGLIVLLSGVGIIYANVKPKETN